MTKQVGMSNEKESKFIENKKGIVAGGGLRGDANNVDIHGKNTRYGNHNDAMIEVEKQRKLAGQVVLQDILHGYYIHITKIKIRATPKCRRNNFI